MKHSSNAVRLTNGSAIRACGLMLLTAIVVLPTGCSNSVNAGPRADAKAVEEIRKTLAAGATDSKTEATGEETAAASGWGTIKGKFKIVGTAPQQGPPLPMAKANADCSKHNVYDESLVVKGDALQGGLIFARTPKLEVSPDAQTPSGEIVLDNKECRFEPHVIFAQAGQKISVKNSDAFGHNTKIDSIINPPQNFSLPASAAIDYTFEKEEQLPVKVGCSIHPWMGAWVLVRSNPYGAVSDSKGEFTIAKLPAGREIEFQLWQEKTGFLKDAKSDAVKVDGKGRFKTKLEPDQELVLEFSIPVDSLK
jgi:plastocyanin